MPLVTMPTVVPRERRYERSVCVLSTACGAKASLAGLKKTDGGGVSSFSRERSSAVGRDTPRRRAPMAANGQ